MNYLKLEPEAFFDETGKPSMVSLSYYCNNIASRKFEYTGYIDGYNFGHLSFNNIVKAKIVKATDIVYQFPDLIETKGLGYYVRSWVEFPDIGNLKSTNTFVISLYRDELGPQFIRNHVKIIDEHTLIINNKELKVAKEWLIAGIDSKNYKDFGL